MHWQGNNFNKNLHFDAFSTELCSVRAQQQFCLLPLIGPTHIIYADSSLSSFTLSSLILEDSISTTWQLDRSVSWSCFSSDTASHFTQQAKDLQERLWTQARRLRNSSGSSIGTTDPGHHEQQHQLGTSVTSAYSSCTSLSHPPATPLVTSPKVMPLLSL